MAQYQEGQTATGPNGQKLVFRGGVWSPVNSGSGAITIGTPDPTLGSKIAKGRNEAAASEYDPALNAENLRGKRLANDKLERDLAEAKPNGRKLTSAAFGEAVAGYKTAQQLRRLVQDIQDRDTEGPGSTKGLMGLKDLFPTTANDRLDKAGQAVRGLVGQALGFTGGQLNSVKEAEMAVGPYIPDSWDRDQTRLDKIRRLQQLANDAEARSIAILGGRPDEAGNIIPLDNGGMPASTLGPAGPGDAVPDPSGDRQFVTEEDRLIAEEAQRAFNNGAGRDELDAIARKYGRPAYGPDLDKAIEARRAGGRANFPIEATGLEDGGFAGGALGGAAATPGGAFIGSFSNAMVPTRLIDPAGADRLEMLKAQYPGAAFAGSVIGGIPAAAALEFGAVRALPGLSALSASRIADTAYGAYQGYGNAEEGEGGMGAVIGGISGLLGGEAGRRLVSGTGRVVRGISDPAVRYLRGQGVGLTAGQAIGRTAKQVEDQVTGYPIIGGIVGNRREEGLVDFNRAMFRQGAEGAQIANIGERGAEQLDDLVTRTYAPLEAVSMTADAPLMSDMAAAASRGQSIPGRADDFDYVVNTRVRPNFDASGGMSGRNYQDAVRQLRIAGNNQGMAAMHPGDFSDALAGVEDALTGMVHRQAPEAVDALEQGNRIYRNQAIIDQAVKAARNFRGPDGDAVVMPSQLLTAATQNTNKFGGASRAATTDRPFYELATAGQDVLPSRVGDSGTAGRLALPAAALAATGGGAAYGGSEGGVTGAAAGGGSTLAMLAGLAALGGTKTGQRAIVSMLADRPEVVRRVGDVIYNKRALGGAIGAPAVIGGVNLLGGF